MAFMPLTFETYTIPVLITHIHISNYLETEA